MLLSRAPPGTHGSREIARKTARVKFGLLDLDQLQHDNSSCVARVKSNGIIHQSQNVSAIPAGSLELRFEGNATFDTLLSNLILQPANS